MIRREMRNMEKKDYLEELPLPKSSIENNSLL